jgi:hypothetical protein
MTFLHLPPSGTDPHRWVNPEAVEWFAAFGTESVIRLRTGDTLRTSLSVTDLGRRLNKEMAIRDFDPHAWIHDPPLEPSP